jgi:hypothetical protein
MKAHKEKTVDQDNPVIDGTEVFLKMMSSESFDNKHKLSNHKTVTAKSYKGVFAVVTDIDGNYLYFDENGNLTTEDKGTVVYQFIRKPYLLEDKLNKKQHALFMIYHSLGKMYKNTLVAASKIAKRVNLPSKEVLKNQTENMNGVYNMRKDIIDNNTSYITQINGGSFGILSAKNKRKINYKKL